MENEYHEHHMPLETLLEELKDIKSSIQNLNAKIDHELTSRATDYKDLSDIVSAQHNQLTTLNKANEELKDQNRKLQIKVLNAQKTCYGLKSTL